MNNDVDEPQELNGFAKFGLLMTKLIVGGSIVYGLYTTIRDYSSYQGTLWDRIIDNGLSIIPLSILSCVFYWVFLLSAKELYSFILKATGVSGRPNGWQCVWIVCYLIALTAFLASGLRF